MLYAIVILISFLAATLITPLVIKAARRYNFLDIPAGLKVHREPTPLLGGLTVFVSFIIAFIAGLYKWSMSWNGGILGLIVGASIIVLLGLIDDKRGMSASIKLLGQILACSIFIILSNSSQVLTKSSLDFLILLFWMVGLINALNFLDVMDGLCSGITFIAAVAFFVLGYFNQQFTVMLVALCLAGASLGFLVYNFPPAKIFLGDTGSMLHGFILASLGILFVKGNSSFSNLLVPILILSYPIFDMTFVTLVRLKEGRAIYLGDYNNSPSRIARLGVHSRKVILWIYLISALLALIAILVFFSESSMKILIAILIGLFLTIFGIHLHRNFAHIKEKAMLVLADVLAVNLIFLFVYWLRFQSRIFPVQIVVPLAEYTAPAIWITLFWINLFAVLGLYDFDWDASLKEMWKSIFKSVSLGVVIFIVFTLGQDYLLLKTWVILGIYAISFAFLLIAERSILVFWFRNLLASGHVKRKAVIVGTGKNAQRLLQDIDSNPEFGYQVIGYARDVPENVKVDVSHLQILGDVEDLSEILKEYKAHEVLIAVEEERAFPVGDIINRVSGIEVNFKVPAWLSDSARGCMTSGLYGGKFLRIHPQPMRAWEVGIKRLCDIFISSLVLILSSPVLLFTWVVLKLKFKSSALIEKTYLGRLRKPFKTYRFRLNNEGEDYLPPQNGFGYFLRRTRIEKLPMLFSTLKGEMSLVGPQPVYVEESKDLSAYPLRCGSSFNVKPGIWSLSLFEKEDSKKQTDNTEDGASYVERMSLWLDAKIFFGGIINSVKKILTNS
ncbi:MAG: sugar transferase [candidate division Zixibacteria bacterium]|nr:sugar transferase [candidate division Zixibacteria bacterium]